MFERPAPPQILFLGSFPPRECGIATFTKDVVDAFDAHFGTKSDVVAIDEPGGDGRVYGPEVAARLVQDDRASYAATARFINEHPADVLCVQHEYGLFGGEHGAWFLDLLDLVEKPITVSLHTVLPNPTDAFLQVTQAICRKASRIIVLAETARVILDGVYDADPRRIQVIHHGVPDVPFAPTDEAKAAFGFTDRLTISTFGLINRGKGLEYAIEAMRNVVKKHPDALYLILGGTHPTIRRQEGESYRESLQKKVADYGLAENVLLVDRYLEFSELLRYLQASDVYLTPYLNPVQIVSGTLAYAMGCGKAIVSTPYLYANEVLSHGRGLLCEFRDAESIAQNVNALLDDPDLRHATERRAYRFGRQMTWPHVAMDYGRAFSEIGPAVRNLSLGATA